MKQRAVTHAVAEMVENGHSVLIGNIFGQNCCFVRFALGLTSWNSKKVAGKL